jgi:protein gp37
MGDNSKIEWTEASWNPVTGCDEVSPGCDHCYAKTFAERWRSTPGHYFEQGFDLQLRPERLDQPLRWAKPRRIFVNSMSDLFHDGIPDSFIAQVFSVMAKTPRHTYQLLTKRHGRMRSLLGRASFNTTVLDSAPGTTWPLPNVWLGVSVENQQWANIRIPALLDTPAAVRWLSMEPLLGPVDLQDVPGFARQYGCDGRHRGDGTPDCPRWSHHHHDDRCSAPLDWVVVGGESGPGARPMHPGWARSLRDECQSWGVPFFFKQWGAWAPTGWRGIGQPSDPRERFVGEPVDEFGHREVIARMAKTAAGRELDGRTWDQYPAAAHG